MKTKLFLLPLLLICLFGCEQSETSTLNVELSETNEVSMYEKSTEDMFDFMKQVYPEKYAKYYSIKNQFKPEILTKVSNNNFAKYAKSTTDENIIDTLLYIVNFGEDDGFAVMDANNGDLLVLTEKGDLHTEDLTQEYNIDDSEIEPKEMMAYLLKDRSITPPPSFGGDPIDPNKPEIIIVGDWVTKYQVEPLVKVKFGQEDPYNRLCYDDELNICPAGCVAIAIIQVMSANKCPNTIGNLTYNWDTIINNYKTNTSVQDVLASWIRTIGGQCNMDYGVNGSAASIYDAVDCFELYPQYKNVTIDYNPTKEEVYSMLSNAKPLYFRAGLDTIIYNSNGGGHAWVVDGCIYQEQKVTTTTLYGAVTSKYTNYRNYVHCNWGWYGECDGYYDLNVFDVREGAIIPDNTTQQETQNYYFSLDIRSIMYNL